jgi:tight adherence protein C
MLLTVSAIFFVATAAISAAAIYFFEQRFPAVADGPGASVSRSGEGDRAATLLARWFPFLAAAANKFSFSEQERTTTRRLLVAAGIRDARLVSIFYGARICLVVASLAGAGIVFFSFTHDWNGAALATLLSATLAYRFPSAYLTRRARSRKAAIGHGLPDLLDLLVISVEAGVSLDKALSDSARDLALVHPVFAEEINLLQAEIRAGTSRSEALRSLAQRTGEPDLKKIVSVLIQAKSRAAVALPTP